MQLQISFTLGTFLHAGEVFAFATQFIHHPLTAIHSTDAFEGGDWIDGEEEYPKITERLSDAKEKLFTAHDGDNINALFGGHNVNSLIYLRNEPFHTEEISVTFKDRSFLNLEGLIRAAIKYGFNLALKFDGIKTRWQSEQFISNFKAEGKDYSNRATILHPLWEKSTGPTINIRENPGRYIRTCKMRLMAAPEIWFGPGAWKYFNCEQIKGCKSITEKQMLEDEVLYVKLFDAEARDYEAPEILKIQREFRQCSNMDKVEDELNALLPFTKYY
ncbi:hypothetical protein [Chitinophaga sp. CF418]|uniref:hypothetical protein n=1 Tax=Chitinophaga sp. CF418 TaxID=1855287 RepID=UPI0009231B7E|nr:hypothetical protein [Chitinophaga sp. CF418]SHN30789.1 hypothetical protein SAMN05216311_108348 [Chitinophaga sp. CF418]